ncbi:MAG: hypothetical protein C0391_08565 [Anaerolinea sp.]|nr:hypothetical protein [Anaerolinea sp.]
MTEDKKVQSPKAKYYIHILIGITGLLLIINLAFLFKNIQPAPTPLPTEPIQGLEANPADTIKPTPFFTPEPALTAEPGLPTPAYLPTEDMFQGNSLVNGTIIMAVVENGFSNLVVYHPGQDGLQSLTAHPWDNIDPALSPDGSRLAYSSKQNGYWNIYVMEMAGGKVLPITDTPEYDASPEWSPDGKRLLIETYVDGYFQLQLVDLSTGMAVITRLTSGNADSYDASWSPDGKSILYISDSGGKPTLSTLTWRDVETEQSDFYLASLEDPAHPIFAPDGKLAAFSAWQDGHRRIFIVDLIMGEQSLRSIGLGDQPVWSPDGKVIFTSLEDPLSTYITAYDVNSARLVMPAVHLPGTVNGLDWNPTPTDFLNNSWVKDVNRNALPLPYTIQLTRVSGSGRYSLAPISGVNLEYSFLHDAVDESFAALRNQLIRETGWDVLSNIQTAFIPISQAPEPDGVQDWFYTGRAFMLNRLPLDVGWMTLGREDFGVETYWRVYLRPLSQDGSLGKPMRQHSWDINDRFSNDPAAYEIGGRLSAETLEGYWVDLTDIARRYGWERLSALPSWTSFYPAARYSTFVNHSGLSWTAAMRELYPPDFLITPELPSQAVSPTATLKSMKTKAPTVSPTLHPTWTPVP